MKQIIRINFLILLSLCQKRKSSFIKCCNLFMVMAGFIVIPEYVFATTFTSQASGNWNTTSTWSPNGTPTSSDDVIISSGYTVTLVTNQPSCRNLTINSGGTFTVSGSNGLDVYGSFTNNGTFNSSTGTMFFKSTSTGNTLSGSLTGSGKKFCHVNFNGSGGGWSFSNDADVEGDLTFLAGAVTAPSGNLNIAGSWQFSGGSFAHNNGTVTFTSTTSSRSINGTMTGSNKFNTLTFNGSGGVWSFNGNTEVEGNFTITNGSVNGPSGLTITIKGNLSNNGSFTHNNCTLNFTATDAGHTITSAGTLTLFDLTFNGSGGVWTISSNTIAERNFAITAGSVTAPSSFTVSSFSNSGTFTHNNGTVTLTGGLGSHMINGSTSTTFYNLVIDQAISLGIAIVVLNNLTINSNANLDVSTSNYAITVGGNWLNNYIFNCRSGTVTFNGSSAQTIGGTSSSSFKYLTISSSSTVTLISNQGLYGNLSVTSGTLDLSTYTLNQYWSSSYTISVSNGASLRLGGSSGGQSGSNFPSGYSSSISLGTTSTVEYYGSSQTIFNTPTYGNLILSGSGNKTFGGVITISSNLSVSGTAVALLPNSTTSSTGTLTLGGAGQNSGSFGGSASGATNKNSTWFGTSTTGIINVTTLTCNVGNWIGAVSTDWNVDTNWCGGIPIASTDVIIPSGGNQPVISASGGTCRNITINSGATLTISSTYTLSVAGNWTNNGTLTANSSTVTFNCSSIQTLNGSSTTTFNNLTINSTTSTTLAVNTSIAGNLTINTGKTLDLGTYTCNRTLAGGILTVAGTLKIGNNTGGPTGSNFPNNFSTNTMTGGTVEYNGFNSITQTVYGTPTYNNLTLTNGSGSGSATKNTSANLTVNGNLTINSGTVLSPGATNTVDGSGTLTGTGTAKVSRTNSVADFSTQYTILTKTLTNLMVDYTGTGQILSNLTYGSGGNGGLTISGTINSGANAATVGGAFIVTGTFTPSSETITMGSSSTITNSGTLTFQGLTINGSSGVTLGSNITVNAALTLTSGNLSIGAYNITMGSSATLAGGSSSSFVYTGSTGQFKWLSCAASANKTFPVGHTNSSAGYTPLVIAFNTGHTTDDFGVVAYNLVANDGTRTGTAYTSTVVKTTWNITETTSGGSDVNLQFQWNGTDEAAGFDRSTCRMAHHNGSIWDNIGNLASATGSNPYTFTHNSYTGTFSPFGMNGSGGPLPVKLIYFKATKDNNFGQLTWATASEKDNDYFTIEKSPDGKNFKSIGKIYGAGNSQQILKYAFTDSNLVQGLNYYRLKQTDYDGKFSYSPVDVITFTSEQNEKKLLNLYPVPASDFIELDMYSIGEFETNLQIINVLGKTILEKNITLYRGQNHIEIDLIELSNGIYFILFDELKGSKSTRFIVNK